MEEKYKFVKYIFQVLQDDGTYTPWKLTTVDENKPRGLAPHCCQFILQSRIFHMAILIMVIIDAMLASTHNMFNNTLNEEENERYHAFLYAAQVSKIVEEVNIGVDEVDVGFDVVDIRMDVVDIRMDVVDIRADVADIRADVADIRADVADIRADVADIRVDVVKRGHCDGDHSQCAFTSMEWSKVTFISCVCASPCSGWNISCKQGIS